LNSEWKYIDDLEKLDKRAIGKINRFKQKFGSDMSIFEEEGYFNDDYTIVDRVLDETYDEVEGEYYAFVKWRSLGYDECTWELFRDVPDNKIAECRQRNNVIDPCKAKERSRPTVNEWKKIPFDITYKDNNQLRDYQVEGVNWLLFCYLNQQNCILADEMGLGEEIVYSNITKTNDFQVKQCRPSPSSKRSTISECTAPFWWLYPCPLCTTGRGRWRRGRT